MAQSRSLRFEWLPAVVLSAALAAAMLAWNPPVGDLAAQVFRTELFQRAGLAIWNATWYGGHYTLTYSVLFPPLSALLSPQLVGTLAVVASSYLFDRIARDRWGSAAHLATLWFGAGVVTLLAAGQLPFALGVALGLASLRCLQLRRGRLALVPAAASALASPVAGAFLAGILIAGAWQPRRRLDARAVRVALLPLGLIVALNLAFPGSGQFPFAFSSYIAIPLWCGAALYLSRGLAEQERQLRQAILGYLIVATVLWLAPNPLGGNAVRLGALFGGPVLAAVMLSRRPRLSMLAWIVLAAAMAGSLYWQLSASVSQVARAVGDPSTSRAYFVPLTRWLHRHGGPTVRVEVPPTANHWEAAYLPPSVELARGWLRQLETTRDRIFYEGQTLGTAAYHAWLRHNAIRYVALPDAPLDYSAIAEGRLIEAHPAYLTPRWSSAHWRVFEVRDPAPLLQPVGGGSARIRWIGPQGFALNVISRGEFLVRIGFTPYWSVVRGSACLSRRGEWTLVRAGRPGILHVAAGFSLGQAWNAMTGARETC